MYKLEHTYYIIRYSIYMIRLRNVITSSIWGLYIVFNLFIYDKNNNKTFQGHSPQLSG